MFLLFERRNLSHKDVLIPTVLFLLKYKHFNISKISICAELFPCLNLASDLFAAQNSVYVGIRACWSQYAQPPTHHEMCTKLLSELDTVWP